MPDNTSGEKYLPLLCEGGGTTQKIREALAASVPFPKRLGTSEDYASLLVSIVEHGYLNGETIRMDGALRMAPR